MRINFYHDNWCETDRRIWQAAAEHYGHEFNPIDVDQVPDEAGIAGVRKLPTIIIDPQRLAIFGHIKASEVDKICSGRL